MDNHGHPWTSMDIHGRIDRWWDGEGIGRSDRATVRGLHSQGSIAMIGWARLKVGLIRSNEKMVCS